MPENQANKTQNPAAIGRACAQNTKFKPNTFFIFWFEAYGVHSFRCPCLAWLVRSNVQIASSGIGLGRNTGFLVSLAFVLGLALIRLAVSY